MLNGKMKVAQEIAGLGEFKVSDIFLWRKSQIFFEEKKQIIPCNSQVVGNIGDLDLVEVILLNKFNSSHEVVIVI